MIDREAVSNALFSLLNVATFSTPLGVNSSTSWVDSGRRLKLFSDVTPDMQPAAYLVAHDEDDMQQGRGIPVKRILPYSLVCYCRAEKGDVGDTWLNVMLKAIEASIAPVGRDTPENVQTLGGMVYKCWIKGKIFRDPGDIDCQAMLIVPIEVTLP